MNRNLPLGVTVQFYRGATGYSLDALAHRLDEWQSAGVTAIAPHGFVGDLDEAKFAKFVALAKPRGLDVLAAFGLGPQHAEDRGKWMGRVAALPDCAGLIMDAEGAFDIHQTDAAKAMCDAVRAAAPTQLVVDQPWFAPRWHSHFPWEEFSACVDVHAPQVYCNDFAKQYGDQRYHRVSDWYARDWQWLEARLASAGLVKPRAITIQGYRWRLADLVDCLLENPRVVMWCEPFPAADAIVGMRAAAAIRRRGFDGDGAVARYQASAGLAADGACGPKTLASLGLAMPVAAQ